MPTSLVLTYEESLQVLACTCICYMACIAQGGPYVLPIGFTLTPCGVQLRLRTGGQAHHALLNDPRVCLAFSLLHSNAVDSVLLSGTAVLYTAPDGAVTANVCAASLSGRRFMLTQAE